jgi:hypothetical protein
VKLNWSYHREERSDESTTAHCAADKLEVTCRRAAVECPAVGGAAAVPGRTATNVRHAWHLAVSVPLFSAAMTKTDTMCTPCAERGAGYRTQPQYMKAWRPRNTVAGGNRARPSRTHGQSALHTCDSVVLQWAGRVVGCLGGRWGDVARASKPCRRGGSAGNYTDREHSASPKATTARAYPCIPG